MIVRRRLPSNNADNALGLSRAHIHLTIVNPVLKQPHYLSIHVGNEEVETSVTICDHIDPSRITKLFMKPSSGDSYRVFSNNQRESVGYFQVLASSSDLTRDRDIAGKPASSFPAADRGCNNVNGQPLDLHN